MRVIIRLIKRIKSEWFSLIAWISLMGGGTGKPRANNFTWLGSHCSVGNNCNFNGMRISGFGKVIIGDNFHSGEGCLIITSNHKYEGNALPYDENNINKDVIIGKNVWIGSRVIILPGSELGDGCIIQAGSVVVGKISPLSIAGGHPAKVFSMRNEKHYWSLEQDHKYM